MYQAVIVSKASGKILASEFGDDALSARQYALDKVYSRGYTAADILVDINSVYDQDVMLNYEGDDLCKY